MKMNHPDDEELEVNDDEDYTDKKVKQRILNARDRLNEVQNSLFSERLIEPDVQYSEIDALRAWGLLVRSFVRDITVLLKHDDVPDNEYYAYDVDLGTIQLVPQDTDGYEFSKTAYDEYDAEYLRREFGFDREASIPQPRTVEFEGLLSLIHTKNYVEERWIVVSNPQAPRPEQEIIETMDRRPIPQKIYEKALMQSDQFLQNVGIGLDLTGDQIPEFGFEEVHDAEAG